MTTDDGDIPNAEFSERKGWVATLLTFLCPGVGYMYVGEIGLGLLANIGVVAVLVGFVALVTAWEVFPVLPFAVLLLAWVVFSSFAAAHVRSVIRDNDNHIRPEGYNHWTIYGAVFLLTYMLPLASIFVFSKTFLWTARDVQTSASYPNVLPGDTVLVKRQTYRRALPPKGSLVSLNFPGSSKSPLLRVAAHPGEAVRVEASNLYINGKRRPQASLADEHIRFDALTWKKPDTKFEYLVEKNGENRYAIAISPSAGFAGGFDARRVDKKHVYLLADNRNRMPLREHSEASIRDSRDFGPVPLDSISGQPLYVAWSISPETGRVRWNRIGLRLR